jgi:hypothetical protein
LGSHVPGAHVFGEGEVDQNSGVVVHFPVRMRREGG